MNGGRLLPSDTDLVFISDLVRCHACPVRYYYEKDIPRTEPARYAVCKQVSYHLGNDPDPAAIWDELLTVHPSIDPVQKEFLDHCIAACRKKEWQAAAEHDVRVVSKKQGIVGMADRIFPGNGFALVRGTGSLPLGAAGADRLRIAAVALCLEEMTGEPVEGGSVEYIPDGIVRFHAVQPRDRRALLAVLGKARAIRNGDIPSRPLNDPCGRCSYRERCDAGGGRRLSDII